MIFPNVPIALRGRGPLVLLSPRQVHPLDEIPYCDNPLGRHCAAVHRCHVTLGFGHNVGRWAFSPRRHRTKLMCDPLALDGPADAAPFPITHVPAAPDSD